MKAIVSKSLNSLDIALGYVLDFILGRFGRKRLIRPLRYYWTAFWSILLICLFCNYILFPFFDWWEGVVRLINHVRWGI